MAYTFPIPGVGADGEWDSLANRLIQTLVFEQGSVGH